MTGQLDLSRLTELQRQLGVGIEEIVATLLNELTRAVAEIEAAIASTDLPGAAAAAHAARNSALMIDAPTLLAALGEIESAARAGDSPAAGAGADRLRTVWPALRRGLEAHARAQ